MNAWTIVAFGLFIWFCSGDITYIIDAIRRPYPNAPTKAQPRDANDSRAAMELTLSLCTKLERRICVLERDVKQLDDMVDACIDVINKRAKVIEKEAKRD